MNCARGELINEHDLEQAMRSGKVGGAALDVFSEEPPKGSALLALPNLIATPHIGASTKEAQEAVGIQIAQQICDYFRDGIAQNAVNLPSLTDLEYQQLGRTSTSPPGWANSLRNCFAPTFSKSRSSMKASWRTGRQTLLRVLSSPPCFSWAAMSR